jgi:hypothetical protein
VRLKKLSPINKVNHGFNTIIRRGERNISYAIWKARKTNEDKARLNQFRRTVNRLVRTAKRSYMGKFFNPSSPSQILWKNLQMVGAAEDKLETGPVMFSEDELNTFYS